MFLYCEILIEVLDVTSLVINHILSLKFPAIFGHIMILLINLKLCPIDINNEINKVLDIINPQVRDIKVNTFFELLPLIIGDSVRI